MLIGAIMYLAALHSTMFPHTGPRRIQYMYMFSFESLCRWRQYWIFCLQIINGVIVAFFHLLTLLNHSARHIPKEETQEWRGAHNSTIMGATQTWLVRRVYINPIN